MGAFTERSGDIDDYCEQNEQQEASEGQLPVRHERLARTFAKEHDADNNERGRYEQSEQITRDTQQHSADDLSLKEGKTR